MAKIQDPVSDLMLTGVLVILKSLLGKMQLELRMTEFNVLISWVGNSVQNIFLRIYSEPGTNQRPSEK